MTKWLTQFTNSRVLAVGMLGFASGLPLALTSSTLQAWFTEAHISLMMIGAVTLLGMPYTFKFLWAPLMDYYGIKGLGKRRGWIMATQAGVALLLLILANMNPGTHYMQMGVVAFLIAVFAASQDIAIDAYRADILRVDERGVGAAYFVFAYRMAALVSGGLALIFADYLGWKLVYELMAVLLLGAMVVTYFTPQPKELDIKSPNLFSSILDSFRDLLQRDKISLILLLVVFYKLGDALALSLMSTFLLQGLQFSLTEVGLAYKVVSLVGSILGVFLGGALLTRWSTYKALLVFGLAQMFSNLMFVFLAIIGKDFSFMCLSLFIESFCSGLSTAAFLAFLMSLCHHRYTASQFALLSAIASIGRVFLGPFAAGLVNWVGWIDFYIIAFVSCIPGILFLMLIKEKVICHAEAVFD